MTLEIYVKVWDSGDEFADRYTARVSIYNRGKQIDDSYYALSVDATMPNGFNQCVEKPEAFKGPPIDFQKLPTKTQRAIVQRITLGLMEGVMC
jgi:hypothetical protein